MSIKTRITRLEEALVPVSAEAWRIADNAVDRGLIQPEEREEFARSWRGFEVIVRELTEAACEEGH